MGISGTFARKKGSGNSAKIVVSDFESAIFLNKKEGSGNCSAKTLGVANRLSQVLAQAFEPAGDRVIQDLVANLDDQTA